MRGKYRILLVVVISLIPVLVFLIIYARRLSGSHGSL